MLDTALCTMAGAAVPLTLANLKVAKVLEPWHETQSAEPIGTWLAGNTIVGGAPAKVSPAA